MIMEEFSIVEKAKRYDEAIKKLRSLHDNYDTVSTLIDVKEELGNIFPELAESEDEKIKKQIIYAIKELPVCGETKRKCIAWLEKQGEKEKFVKKELDCIRGYRDEAIRRLQELEKQGESTDILDDAVLDSNKDGLIADTIRRKREKQGNDNVETKFHEGDWVILTVGELSTTLQIVEVDTNKGLYWFNDSRYLPIVDEECLRLWTIQDAKDGDVLCTYECGKPKIVFILKGAPKKPYVFGFHCYYNIMYPHFDFDSEKGCLAPNIEDVKLATKEQRDLLFQKMKEEGYEWEAEKRELKKIEQKPTDLPKGEDYGIDGLYAAVDILQKTLGKVEGYQTADGILEHECAISAVKDLSKQKPTEWSEEDERTYKSIIYSFAHNYPLTIQQQEFVKSLRPQPHWKPSDVQLDALHDAAVYVDKSMFPYSKGILMKLYKQLKKLREE